MNAGKKTFRMVRPLDTGPNVRTLADLTERDDSKILDELVRRFFLRVPKSWSKQEREVAESGIRLTYKRSGSAKTVEIMDELLERKLP